MANGVTTGSGAAAFLENAIAGYLGVRDIKRRDALDRADATERERLRRRQEMLDAQRASQLARANAFQDITLREELGLEYVGDNGPGQAAIDRVNGLRRGVGGDLLSAAGDPLSAVHGAAPPGFRRVGPSREQEATAERRATGQNIMRGLGVGGISPEAVMDMIDQDVLDEYLERTTPQTPTVNWQVQETANGLVQVNPQTGEVRPLAMGGDRLFRPEPAPRATTPLRPTEVQMRLHSVLPRAETALTTIENLVESFGGTVPASTLLRRAGIGGQYASPEQEQNYNQAAEAIATAILRAESGAAITPDEIQRYREQFIPAPGDKPTTVQQKINALRETLEAMREMAGAGGAVVPERPGAGFFDDLIPGGGR